MKVQTNDGARMVNCFGGHAQACGFSLHKNLVEEFMTRVYEETSQIPDEHFKYNYEIMDTLISIKLLVWFINWMLFRLLVKTLSSQPYLKLLFKQNSTFW